MKTSFELENAAAQHAAALMVAAARTAPKTRGIDNIKIIAIDDEPTRRKLVAKMRDIDAAGPVFRYPLKSMPNGVHKL